MVGVGVVWCDGGGSEVAMWWWSMKRSSEAEKVERKVKRENESKREKAEVAMKK